MFDFSHFAISLDSGASAHGVSSFLNAGLVMIDQRSETLPYVMK
jgi:hypothetical protein